MDKRRITPNVISYNAAISACEKSGQWEKALELLREMDNRIIKPKVISYCAAISACEKGCQWEKALELLREMDKRGIKPDVISYNAAISACQKGGQWEKALGLLREMGNRNITPNAISYSAAIKACFDCTEYAEGLRVVRTALEHDIYPNFLKQGQARWDLHDLPLATACMLLADSLLMMVVTDKHISPSYRDIGVITGKGNRSGPEGPVLQTKIPQFLQIALGLETTPVKGNTGMFLVTKTSLQVWADSHHSNVKTEHQLRDAVLKDHSGWTIVG
jgi:pentatricopeptide repeat protein